MRILNADPNPGGKMNTDPDPQPWSCSAAKFLIKYLFFGQVAKDILAGLHQAEAEILPYDEQVKVRQHEKFHLFCDASPV